MQIYHHYRFWECVKAGMYDSVDRDGRQHEECLELYADFLRNTKLFQRVIGEVMVAWPISCEQFLTNVSLNRVAWLGQASACLHLRLPRKFRAGFMLLSDSERRQANKTALNALATWSRGHRFVEPLFSNLCLCNIGGSQKRAGRLAEYVQAWSQRGYEDDIPDLAPSALERERLAPSYRMIARAILSNDLNFHSLGFQPFKSSWYGAIKKNEILARKA